MKIRIITSKVFPNGYAAAERISNYASIFDKAGYNVIITSFNSNSSYNEGLKCLKYTRNVKLEIYPTAKWSIFKNNFQEVLEVKNEAVNVKENAVLIYGFSSKDQLKLIKFYKNQQIPIILELNELPFSGDKTRFDKIIDLRTFKRNQFLRKSLPYFDGVIVISESLEKIAERYYNKEKILKLPILVNPNNFIKGKNVFSDDNFKLRKPYIIHTGSLSQSKDGILEIIESWCQANKVLQDKSQNPIFFYTTNLKTERKIIKRIYSLINIYGMNDYFKVIGNLNENILDSILRGALIHIINKPNSLQNAYNFPTKFAKYLISGVPVICAAESIELVKYVEHNENVYLTEPCNIKGIRDGILTLLNNSKLYTHLGYNGKNLAVSKFSADNNGVDLIRFFISIIDND